VLSTNVAADEFCGVVDIGRTPNGFLEYDSRIPPFVEFDK
jgi:hypothetical protein